MEALKEIGAIIGIIFAVIFVVVIIICAAQWFWWEWQQGRINKAYEKALAEHEAAKAEKSKKAWEEIMRSSDRDNFHKNKFSERNGHTKKTFAPEGKHAERSEAFNSASELAGAFGISSSQVSDSLNYGVNFTPDIDTSPSNHSSFEGFGSGGDFGGGGSSGSWDSGSDSSGNSYSSSYND